MYSTLSKLYSAIYLGLGSPEDDILQRLELANIVFRRLSFRLETVRQSNQAEAIAKTADITLASGEDEVTLTDEVDDFVIPLWCEARGYNYLNNATYYFVPTVNISMLQEQRDLGRLACAFYGANPREVKVKFSYFGNEMPGTPFTEFRCWYSPTITFPSNEQQTIELPENLVSMVQYDAMVSALPLMIANASKQLSKRPELVPLLEAWKLLLASIEIERQEFSEFFNKWRRESRGSHRPQMRKDVLTTVLGNSGPGMPWFITNAGGG